MMKKILHLFVCWTILVLSLSSCIKENLVIKDQSGPDDERAISVMVTDGGYGGSLATRADESNEEEYDGDKTFMRTRFIAGDKIGVFSISEEGATHYQNMELAYDGTEWRNPAGDPFYYYTGMKYFAYYPYDKNIDTDKLDWSSDTATGFFAEYINEWMPQEDQSTTKKYIASDLMVGNGSLTDEGTYTFSLGHTMGLIFISAAEEIKGTIYLFPKLSEADAMENLSSESKIYSFEQKVYKPSRRQGYYRYIVKPGSHKFISGKSPDGRLFSFSCSNVSAGRYKKYIIDGGYNPSDSDIEDFTVRIGDVLFKDMHIEHRPEDSTQVNKNAVGAIVYMADHNDEYTEGHSHGLVLYNTNTLSSNNGVSWTNSKEVYDNPAVANCISVKEAIEDKSGLSNCLASKETHIFGDLVREHNTQDPIHDKATPWFIPSSGQWIKIIYALGGNIISPLNQYYDKIIEFSYQSTIIPGNTTPYDDLRYLWTSFYKFTNKNYHNPAACGLYYMSSTETNINGDSIWCFKIPKNNSAPYGSSEKKTSNSGMPWRCLAF